MKKIAFILLMASATVFAQQQPQPQNPDKVIKLDTHCSSQERVMAMLKQYGERPMLKMISNRQSPKGDTVELVTIMFVNPEKQTYSIVEQFNKEMLCVTGNGEKVLPYLGNDGPESPTKERPESSRPRMDEAHS